MQVFTLIFVLAILAQCLVALGDIDINNSINHKASLAWANDVSAVQALAARVLGTSISQQISFQRLSSVKNGAKKDDDDNEDDDTFEYDIGVAPYKVVIKANHASGLTAGLGWYLKHDANVQISWSGNQLDAIAKHLPAPKKKTSRKRIAKYSYYMNVCTLSYSMVWWDWARWESELDWMALNGINSFLAFVGQEYIWSKLFTETYNIKPSELDSFFTGPAFLAWQRMGNIQGWAGPLSMHWMKQQHDLQLLIVARARSLRMKTIMPAFAGHVPAAMKKLFPQAEITLSSSWGSFKSTYSPVNMIAVTDPMFIEIGKKFLKLLIQEYGTDHLYNADTFNEMRPTGKEKSLEYLTNASASMIKSLVLADNDAVWIMQGWLFQDEDFWTLEKRNAYLRGADDTRMIILDLFSDVSPLYPYSGKRWIWNMLHNFGGNFGLYGRLQVIREEPLIALAQFKGSMVGVGISPEGIEQNYFVYEFMLEMAFTQEPPDLKQWTQDYVRRRYGVDDDRAKAAWLILLETVYTSESLQSGVTKSLFERRPTINVPQHSFMTSTLFYDRKHLVRAWQDLLSCADALKHQETYQYDLVDVTRQVLSDHFLTLHGKFGAAFRARHTEKMQILRTQMLDLLIDLDNVLSSNKYFLLGNWIESARSRASSLEMADLFEFNARNQITLWGPQGEINDYASKSFSGLVRNYYRPRWVMFFKCILDDINCDIRTYRTHVLLFEQSWQVEQRCYATYPLYDTVEIVNRMAKKYSSIVRLSVSGVKVEIK